MSATRTMARARIGFAFLGITPSAGLLRFLAEPRGRLDQRDNRRQPADEVAVDAERRHAYLAPYLLDHSGCCPEGKYHPNDGEAA